METKIALLTATSFAVLGTLLAAKPWSRGGPQWLHKAGRYAIEERLIGGELRAEVLLNRDTGNGSFEVWRIYCSLGPRLSSLGVTIINRR